MGMDEEHPTEQEHRTAGERVGAFVGMLVGDWRPSGQQFLQWVRITIVVAFVLFVVLLLLYAIGRRFDITLLNLLKVLAVPITVGAAVPLLNWLQKKRELDVEHERAQDETLQGYLEQMGQLLLDKNRPLLRRVKEEGEVQDDQVQARAFARALTVTVLGRLDATRKRSVLQFLHESDLDLDLRGADLRDADLRQTTLGGANLRGVNLQGANLSSVNLRRATLRNADLSGANLRGADLYKADLSCFVDEEKRGRRRTSLRSADLRGAKLRKAHLEGVDLTDAKLEGARMPFGGYYDSNWLEYLLGSIEDEEDVEWPHYLDGATMPDGRTFEDWRMSKGSREDGEYNGPS
jgi:uncharacterized protein YjbI with pentapeptide repeats